MKIWKIGIVLLLLWMMVWDVGAIEFQGTPINGSFQFGESISGNINVYISNLSYSQPYTYSQVSPYSSVIAGVGNINGDPNEFLETTKTSRIRQDGYISNIKFYCTNASAIQSFRFSVWRKNNTKYDRIYISDNLQNNISTGLNTIYLNSTKFVHEGDYPGYYLHTDDNVNCFHAIVGEGTTYLTRSTLDDYEKGFDFESKNSYIFRVPIEIYMNSPECVFIGDSICAGHPGHYSFIESSGVTNLNSTYELYFGRISNASYQNMGIGGQETTAIKARFYDDVINQTPNYAVIEGGVNDVAHGVSNETILDNWEWMMSECVNNSITPVAILILPWHAGSTAQKKQIDYLNEQIQVLAEIYGAIVIDARDTIGYYDNETGTWDVDTEYNADGVHFTESGYEVIGEDIFAQWANIKVTCNETTRYWNSTDDNPLSFSVINTSNTIITTNIDSMLGDILISTRPISNFLATPISNFLATPISLTASNVVTFTDNSLNTPTSWLWDFGDGETSTEQNPTHTYEEPGIYTVSLVVTNDVGSDILIKNDYIKVDIDYTGSSGIATSTVPIILITLLIIVISFAIMALRGGIEFDEVIKAVIGIVIIMVVIYIMYGVATLIENVFKYSS